MITLNVRDKVEEFCYKNKLSQKEFCSKVGVCKATLQKFYKGDDILLVSYKKIVNGANGKIKVEFQ